MDRCGAFPICSLARLILHSRAAFSRPQIRLERQIYTCMQTERRRTQRRAAQKRQLGANCARHPQKKSRRAFSHRACPRFVVLRIQILTRGLESRSTRNAVFFAREKARLDRALARSSLDRLRNLDLATTNFDESLSRRCRDLRASVPGMSIFCGNAGASVRLTSGGHPGLRRLPVVGIVPRQGIQMHDDAGSCLLRSNHAASRRL